MLKNLPSAETEPNKKRRLSKRISANHATENVGRQLRALRKSRRVSIRALAELSGLSVNTLSLIENGKTSPSVSTLYQLAQSLDVSITAFFEDGCANGRVIFQKAGERQQIIFAQGQMESLNTDMLQAKSEPFITKLEPGAESGEIPIVYAGKEFVYCLEGQITYVIEGKTYSLSPGDSLIFDAYVPHKWHNSASNNSRALLVLCPEDDSEDISKKYFIP